MTALMRSSTFPPHVAGEASQASAKKPERLSREDSARWHMATPENPMVIGALLLFDQRLALETVEELVRRKLVPHRRFRQHVVEPRASVWQTELARRRLPSICAHTSGS